MNRRQFLLNSIFLILITPGQLTASEADPLEITTNKVLSLVNSLLKPLDQIGESIDKIRFNRERDLLQNRIETLLWKKQHLKNLMSQKPLSFSEISSTAAGVSPDVIKFADSLKDFSFGLRKQFEDEGNKLANELRNAAQDKSWVTTVMCCSQSLSESEFNSAIQSSERTITALEKLIFAISKLKTIL